MRQGYAPSDRAVHQRFIGRPHVNQAVRCPSDGASDNGNLSSDDGRPRRMRTARRMKGAQHGAGFEEQAEAMTLPRQVSNEDVNVVDGDVEMAWGEIEAGYVQLLPAGSQTRDNMCSSGRWEGRRVYPARMLNQTVLIAREREMLAMSVR